MPKKCLNVFNRCLAVVASFLGGAPGESDYTDGVKLKMLIPGLLLGSDSSSRLFAIVVYERCQDFLGSMVIGKSFMARSSTANRQFLRR